MEAHPKGSGMVKNSVKSSNRVGKGNIGVFALEFLWKKVNDAYKCFRDAVFVTTFNYQAVTLFPPRRA